MRTLYYFVTAEIISERARKVSQVIPIGVLPGAMPDEIFNNVVEAIKIATSASQVHITQFSAVEPQSEQPPIQ